MPAAPPVIDTPRLRLRPHRAADHAELSRLWMDPVVCRFIGGRPSTADESWSRMLRYAGLWPLLGYGYLAIEARDTGAYIGDVGLADFHRVIDPPLAGRPEAGWILDPALHGRGLASEALNGLLSWADATLARSIVAIIDPANLASLKLAARSGFAETAVTDYRGNRTLVYERPAPTLKPRRPRAPAPA